MSIIEAIKEVETLKQRFNGLGMVNTSGKTLEEKIKLRADYELARLEFIHAENRLSKILNHRAPIG